MEFRPVKPEEYEAVRRFLAGVGWEQRVSDPERFRKMMEQAARTVVAWDDQMVVGFARALCDEASNGYISMVAVAADYRGRGIGRQMIKHLIADESDQITWILRAGHGSKGFWEKIGFRASDVAMEKVRQK